MEPEHSRVREIDAFWAGVWKCDPVLLQTPGVAVIAREIEGYPEGLQIHRRRSTTIIGAPPHRLQEVRSALAPISIPPPLSGPRLAAALGREFDADAFHAGYRFCVDPELFEPVVTAACALTSAERTEVHLMLAACPRTEVEEAEVDSELPVLYGIWEDGQWAALAGFQTDTGPLADVRVIVHPAHRRKGLARQVTSALCALGLARGWLVQYQSADWNHASLALARAPGCRLWTEMDVILPERETPQEG